MNEQENAKENQEEENKKILEQRNLQIGLIDEKKEDMKRQREEIKQKEEKKEEKKEGKKEIEKDYRPAIIRAPPKKTQEIHKKGFSFFFVFFFFL